VRELGRPNTEGGAAVRELQKTSRARLKRRSRRQLPRRGRDLGDRIPGGVSSALGFPRYCYYQYCVVYSVHTGGRKGSLILCNNHTLVLHQGGPCRWAEGMKGWLIRARVHNTPEVNAYLVKAKQQCVNIGKIEYRGGG